jgi:hypothetical protein
MPGSAFFFTIFVVARSGGCPVGARVCDLPAMAGFAAGLLTAPVAAVAGGWITISRLSGRVRQTERSASPPRQTESARLPRLPSWLRRTIGGAIAGASIGAVFPLVALFMGALLLVFAKYFPGDAIWLGAFIMLGFAVAGSLVGLLRPFARTPITRYLVGVLGATIAAAFALLRVDRPVRGWGLPEVVFIALVAIIGGLLITRSLRDSPMDA